MSAKHDKLKQVRLTPKNHARLKRWARTWLAPVSINVLANAAIERGVPEIKTNHEQKKS